MSHQQLTFAHLNHDLKDFDLTAGKDARDDGKKLAAEKRRKLLSLARDVAVLEAGQRGEVTADDVMMALIELGHNPRDLGNAAGSIFKGRRWVFTGSWKQSRRISNHARAIRVWRLRNKEVT